MEKAVETVKVRGHFYICFKKLTAIFIFSFWVFLSFSENGGQPGAAPEVREADFL